MRTERGASPPGAVALGRIFHDEGATSGQDRVDLCPVHRQSEQGCDEHRPCLAGKGCAQGVRIWPEGAGVDVIESDGTPEPDCRRCDIEAGEGRENQGGPFSDKAFGLLERENQGLGARAAKDGVRDAVFGLEQCSQPLSGIVRAARSLGPQCRDEALEPNW
jgi:hypothetical protein